MTSPIEKVQALLARTASSHEEEARTCAVIAARMMREHGLVVVEQGRGAVRDKAAFEEQQRLIDRQRGRIAELMFRLALAEMRAPPAPAPRAEYDPRREPPAKREPTRGAQRIRAKHAILCRACGEPIPLGGEADWDPRRGVKHPGCAFSDHQSGG